jgi:poly(A) polymerase
LNRRRTGEAATRRPAPRILRTDEIPARDLDPNAVHVVERLQRFGHSAYLVGGCVRDLLLRRVPKDFDVATSARPRQIRRVFRNCRIIGRRFKLAHVVFGEEIVETSTFRTIPSGSSAAGLGGGDLLITSDNEFGTAEEDAQRRDFTVNALFYDPARREVIDYIGGLDDLGSRLIRTVGDPQIRFREDPVRILRAIKFASRLDFHFEPATFDAMRDCAGDLEKGAPPRVLEEILRLLRSGTAESAFRLLDQTDALAVILPEIDQHLRACRSAGDGGDEELFASLRELDRRFAAGEEPSAGFALAVLFEGLVQRAIARRSRDKGGPQDLLSLLDEAMGDFAERTRLSRRDSGTARRISLIRHRLEHSGRRRQRPMALVRQEDFDEALDLLAIECAVRPRGDLREIYLEWHERRLELAREGGLEASDPTRRSRLLAEADPSTKLAPHPAAARNPRAPVPPAAPRVERPAEPSRSEAAADAGAGASEAVSRSAAAPAAVRAVPRKISRVAPAAMAPALPPTRAPRAHGAPSAPRPAPQAPAPREPDVPREPDAPREPQTPGEPEELPFGFGIFDATEARPVRPARPSRRRR